MSLKNQSHISSPPASFLSTVAIIYRGLIPDQTTANLYYPVMEIKSFSPDFIYHHSYVINNKEFADNGLLNDELGHDFFYTSVQGVVMSQAEVDSLNSKMYYQTSDNFQYNDSLMNYLNSNNPNQLSIEVSCKFRTAPCPETNWLNDCWFASPCTCIEYYDCEVKVSLSIFK